MVREAKVPMASSLQQEEAQAAERLPNPAADLAVAKVMATAMLEPPAIQARPAIP